MVSLSLATLLTHRFTLHSSLSPDLQVSAHPRYELHVLDAFTLETYFVRLWQTLFLLSIKYISFYHLMAWQQAHSFKKINVPAMWQNSQH